MNQTDPQSSEEYVDYITVGDVADLLGVSIDTVRRWEKVGKLTAERLDGKNRYFAVDEVEAFKSTQPLLTSEVSKLLGISTSSVRRLESNGELVPSRDEKGRRQYSREQVHSYLNPQQNTFSENFTDTPDTTEESFGAGYAPAVAEATVLDSPLQVLEEELEQGVSEIEHKVQDSFSTMASQAGSMFSRFGGGQSYTRLPRSPKKRTETNHETSDSVWVKAALVFSGVLVGVVAVFIALFMLFPSSMSGLMGYDDRDDKAQNTLQLAIRPFANTALGVVGAVDPNLANTINPKNSTPNSTTVVNNSSGDSVSVGGHRPGYNSGDLALLPINGSSIRAKTVTGQQLADGTIQLSNLSPSVISSLRGSGGSGSSGPQGPIGLQGLQGPPGGASDVIAGLGLNGGGSNGSITLAVTTGNTTEIVNDAVDVRIASNGSTSTTSSVSGLETSTQGLRMVGGCSNGQILKWNGSAWACNTDNTGGGGGSLTVQTSDNSTVVNSVSNLQFGPASGSSSEFQLTNIGGGQVRVQIGNNVLQTTNYTATLDPTYVNTSETPASGDIAGSFTAGFNVVADAISLGVDTTGNYVGAITGSIGIQVSGSGSENASVSLALDTTTTGTTGTSSGNSGLEIGADGLRLLGGCSNNQILKWSGSAWVCSSDEAGSGAMDVKENNSTVVGAATGLDFLGADFIVANSAGEADISLDYANSGITRRSATETITGAWSFSDTSLIIQDNADVSKQLVFELSGLTAGVTRILSAPNVNGTLITTGNLADINTVGAITVGTWQGSIVGTQYGGTGVNGSTAANGQLLIGNGSGYSLTTLTQGSGINISNASGSITIVATLGDSISNSEIDADAVTLGTQTTGSYISTLGSLTGLSATGNSGEGSTPTLSVSYGSVANTAVQGDTTINCPTVSGSNLSGGGGTITLGTGGSCTAIGFSATPTFTSVNSATLQNSGVLSISTSATIASDDIVFSTAGTESMRILEGGDIKFEKGANDAFLSIATPSGASATYTFSGATGTVLTSANFSGSLDSSFVNVGESPASGDISGSFGGGLTIGPDAVALGTDTTGNYLATLSGGTGLTVTGSGSENAAASLSLDVVTTGTTATISTNSGLELGSDGLRLLGGCASNEILKWNGTAWSCAEDNGTGAAPTLQENYDNDPNGANVLIALSAVDGGIFIRDNATPIGGNLFAVQSDGGSTTYLGVTASGASVAGTFSATGTINGATISGGSLSATAVNGLSVSGGTVSAGTWNGTALIDAYVSDTLTIGASSTVADGALSANVTKLGSAIDLATSEVSGNLRANNLQSAGADLGAANVNIDLGNTNGAFVTNLTVDGTITAATFTGNLSGNVTGNADTASALATNPTDCASDTYATTIAANGNLTCASITDASLSANVTKLGSSIQNSEVDDDLTISASGSVADGALSANVTKLGSAIDLATSEVAGNLRANNLQSVAADLGAADITINLGNTNGAFNTNLTLDGIITASSFSGALTGNASTASALAANPTDCSANQFATTIAANGNLTCASLTDGDIPNSITIDLAATATALAANPTDCSANQFATTIAANGNLTCASLTDGDVPDTLTIGASSTVADGALSANVTKLGSAIDLATSEVSGNLRANNLQSAGADLGAANVNIDLGNTNGAFVTNLTVDGTITAATFTGNLSGNVTGNADTASALATNPTDCASDTYATTIAANGNLTCASITDASLSANVTKLGSSIQNSEVDDDLTISASGSVADGALSANVTKLGSAIDLATSEVAGNLRANNLQSVAADLGAADITINLGNTNGAFNTNLTLDGIITASSFSGALTGNASTASALAANPSDCSANQFATTIAANGNLTCASLTDGDVPDTLTIGASSTVADGALSVNVTKLGSAIDLGAETVGDYVQNLGALTGLSTSGNSGEGSTPTLSVLYGSSANTAVQGNTALVCASGSGNLTGGGNTITLGGGGTCNALDTNSAVSFATSVTTPLLQNAGSLILRTQATAGADDIIFQTAGVEHLRLLESGVLSTINNLSVDLNSASNRILTVANSGTGVASLSVEGGATFGANLTIASGGITVTGNSSVSGTLTTDALQLNNQSITAWNQIPIARIGASTYSTIQHALNLYLSPGHLSGGEITDAGSGNISVGAGTGAIRATDSDTAELRFFDWPSATINIPSGSKRFIGVIYNAGSPIVTAKTSDTWNYDTEFPIGVVIYANSVMSIENNPMAVGDSMTNIIERLYETSPRERNNRSGGLILGETGTRNLTVSAGKLWDRLNEYPISAFDSSAGSTWTRYWRDGSGGFFSGDGRTQWDNQSYDDGSGTLQTMTAGYYSNRWYYVTTDNKMVGLWGTNQYESLAEAQAEKPPTQIPDRLVSFGTLIGRIVIQKDANTTTLIESAFNNEFTGSVVTAHSSLAGLDADDHSQYALLEGRSGGQTLFGGTAASNSLILQSTSDTTKGNIILNSAGGLVGIGTSGTPSQLLSIGGTTGNLTVDASGNLETIGSIASTMSGGTALSVSGAPTNSATLSLLRVGEAIADGNSAVDGGTYIGLNLPASGPGSAADLLNFQKNGTSLLRVDNSGNVNVAGTITAPTFSGALTGNASTATALAANPSDCSANQFATIIAANGDLTCVSLTDLDIPNNITIDLADTASALATNPTDCASDTYATTIAANGNLTCASITDASLSANVTKLGSSIQNSEVDDDLTISASGSVADGALSANVTKLGSAIDLATSEVAGNLRANNLQSVAADLGAADITINLGNTNGAFNTNLTLDGIITASSFSGALTGNASTASALAANPSDCSANQFATTIAANGNLTCASLTDGDIPNSITIDLAATATALAANPTDCSANQFATTIAANGNLTCASLTDGDVPDTLTIGASSTVADGALSANVTKLGSAIDLATSEVSGNLRANNLQSAGADLGAANVNIDLGNTNGAFVTNLTVDGTITAATFTGNLSGNVTGNADTASALATNPTDCASDTYATTIAANGNLTCASITDASLSANVTKLGSSIQNSEVDDDLTISASGSVADGALSANVTKLGSAIDLATSEVAGNLRANNLQSVAADLGAADITINLGNTNGAFNTNLTLDGIITASSFSGALTGNASTASALAANPSDCSANQFATTIAANGNLTCASLTDGDIPNSITIDLAATATALAANPTDCSANQFATTIAANGNLTCASLTDGDVPDTLTIGASSTVADGALSANVTKLGSAIDLATSEVSGNLRANNLQSAGADLGAANVNIDLGNTNGAFVTNLTVDGTITAATFTGNLSGNVTGNADTASALATNPTDCASDTYATTIAANGNLTCASITDASLSANVTKLGSSIQNSEVDDDLTISASGSVADGALSANVTKLGSAIDLATSEVAGNLRANNLQSVAADLGAADITINLGNTNGAFNTNLTLDGIITASSFSGALTGNASTASALAANPSDCSANQFATTIAANGNLTCASLTDGDIPNSITIDLAATATALAANPTDCSANQFATTIAANGNLTCASLTDGDVPDTLTIGASSTVADGALSANVTKLGSAIDLATSEVSGNLRANNLQSAGADLGAANVNIDLGNTNGAFVTNLTVDGTITAATFTGNLSGNVTGNADTASALATNPTDCASDTYATTIAANGNLTCASITDASLSANVTKLGSSIQNSEVDDDLTISASGSVADGALSANVTKLGSAIDLATSEVAGNLRANNLQSVAADLGAADITINLGNTNGAFNTNLTLDGIITASSFSGALTGNASTASALAANPSDCSANQFATTIAANGNLTCASLTDGDIPNSITIDLAATATALAANPTDCSANQFATTIAANGNLTCASLTDGDVPDTLTIGASSTVADGALSANVTKLGSAIDLATSEVSGNLRANNLQSAGADLGAANVNIDLGNTNGAFVTNLTVDGTITAATFTGNLSGNVTGNADTASALATNPTDCASDTYATTIAANGNLTCASITDASLSANVTKLGSSIQNSEVDDDLTISASGSVADGALSANVTKLGSAIDLATSEVAGNLRANNLQSVAADLGAADITINLGNTNGAFNTNLTLDGIITASSFSGALTGNASTASALAANPSDCSANQFATTIAANGNLTCASLTDGDIPNSITIDLAATATALAANPTDCSANQFATTIAANGNLTCASLTDGDVPDTLTIGASSTVADGALSANVTKLGSAIDLATSEVSGNLRANNLQSAGADLGAANVNIDLGNTNGAFVTNLTVDGTITAATFTGNLSGNVTGNADTASALATNPTDCSGNQFANAIAASGNLTCASITDADVSNTLTASIFVGSGSTTDAIDLATAEVAGQLRATNLQSAGADLGAANVNINLGNTNGAFVTNLTVDGTITAATFVGALTGNASTATALATNPTDCSANQFANAIAASGNLTCAALVDADILDNITLNTSTIITGTAGFSLNRTLSVNSGSTQNVQTITFASPADTAGTNVSQGLNITPTIGNATAGTNTANIINIDDVTGDAQVTLNAFNIGALTGTAAQEYGINVGSGWDAAINIAGSGLIRANGNNGITIGTACGATQYIGAARVNGGVITNGTCTNDGVSDARLKTNVNDLVGGSVLERLNQLNAVSYNFNQAYYDLYNTPIEDKGIQYGFIAQDLQSIFPELVSEDHGMGGYLGINYHAFYGLLTSAVQELDQKVNDVTKHGFEDLEGEGLTVKLKPEQIFAIKDVDNNIKASIDAEGNAMFAGTVVGANITRLEQDVADLKNRPNGQEIDLQNLSVGNLRITLDIFTDGSMTVMGDADFRGTALFQQLATFNGEVQFNGTTNVNGEARFNNNTGGYAQINPGQQAVRVNFTQNYSQVPVVSLSLGDGKFARYSYKNLTSSGFDIVLDLPTTEQLNFSWLALNITNPTTHYQQ